MSVPSGVLPVDKPEGPTSHDVVAAARRALGTRRIGHTGTLDPFASGLLLLCLESATRLAEYLTALPKTYRATLRLGEETDTDDHTGEVIRRSEEWRRLAEQDLRDAFARQVGEIQQVPPRYSAKKVAGERMYKAARRGEEIERKPVRVTVYRIDLLRFDSPQVEFEVECSSGTYIRAIARDVGEAVGVGAHLSVLRRTRVGDHQVERAVPVADMADAERVRDALLPPIAAVAHLPRVVVAESHLHLLANGRPVPGGEDTSREGPVALCSAAGDLLAIGDPRGELVHPRKVFV